MDVVPAADLWAAILNVVTAATPDFRKSSLRTPSPVDASSHHSDNFSGWEFRVELPMRISTRRGDRRTYHNVPKSYVRFSRSREPLQRTMAPPLGPRAAAPTANPFPFPSTGPTSASSGATFVPPFTPIRLERIFCPDFDFAVLLRILYFFPISLRKTGANPLVHTSASKP